MPSYIPCKKNDTNGLIFYVSLVSQADTKIMQANPTLANGDVIRALDDAAPANLGTLPVVDADFTKRVKVTLSQAETNADNITIIFSDAAGAEWCDLTINIQTTARQIDDLAFPTTSGKSLDVSDTGEAGLDFNNIKDATGAHTLTNITVPVATSVGTVTGNVDGNVGGNVTGTVASVVGNVGGTVASVVGDVGGNVTGTVASVVGDVGGNVTGTVASVIGDVGGAVVGSVASVVADVTVAALSRAAIADDTWDEAIAGHLGVGSTGEKLNSASAPTSAQVADAVLDELTSEHTTVGSLGKRVQSMDEKAVFDLG